MQNFYEITSIFVLIGTNRAIIGPKVVINIPIIYKTSEEATVACMRVEANGGHPSQHGDTADP